MCNILHYLLLHIGNLTNVADSSKDSELMQEVMVLKNKFNSLRSSFEKDGFSKWEEIVNHTNILKSGICHALLMSGSKHASIETTLKFYELVAVSVLLSVQGTWCYKAYKNHHLSHEDKYSMFGDVATAHTAMDIFRTALRIEGMKSDDNRVKWLKATKIMETLSSLEYDNIYNHIANKRPGSCSGIYEPKEADQTERYKLIVELLKRDSSSLDIQGESCSIAHLAAIDCDAGYASSTEYFQGHRCLDSTPVDFARRVGCDDSIIEDFQEISSSLDALDAVGI